MSVPPTGDYAPSHVPTIFMEAPPPPPPAKPPEEKGGIVISRGFLAILAVLLLGALIASTAGLLMLRSGDQKAWDTAKAKLEGDIRTLSGERDGLKTANGALTANLEEAKLKAQQYGAFEFQLNLIAEKTKNIMILRDAKPSFPKKDLMDLTKIPDYSKPGEDLLKAFVAKMDKELVALTAFKEVQRPDPGPVNNRSGGITNNPQPATTPPGTP
jgi:hypothetical protein